MLLHVRKFSLFWLLAMAALVCSVSRAAADGPGEQTGVGPEWIVVPPPPEVLIPCRADLVITEAVKVMMAGKPTLRYTIKNQGCSNAGPFWVYVYRDAHLPALIHTPRVEGLRVGESITLSRGIDTCPTNPYIRVDRFNEVAEGTAGEANNTRRITFC